MTGVAKRQARWFDRVRTAIGRRELLAAGALLAAAHVTSAQEQADERKHSAGAYEDVEGRQRWYWYERTYPSGSIPEGAMQRARLQAAQLSSTAPLRMLFGSYGMSTAAAWRSLGPYGLFGPSGFYGSGGQLEAGRVNRLGLSNREPGTLYIATAAGGVWRGTTNGSGWTALGDRECSLQIGAVAVDPVVPSLVYAGTGDFDGGGYGCGMLRSTDAGATWTTVDYPGLVRGVTSRILIDSATAGSSTGTTVLAATNGGLFRSTNSGTSWTRTLTNSVSSVVTLPGKAGVLFAGVFANGAAIVAQRGVYRSADGGVTWTQLPAFSATVDVNRMRRITLATTPAAPNTVFALAIDTTLRAIGVFRWDDVAAQWTTLESNGLYTGNARTDFGAQGSYDFVLAVDPADAALLYIAGVRAFRSRDGGKSFLPMGTEIHSDWHDLQVDPRDRQRLWAATDGGVFTSSDAGATWFSRNAGLAIAQYYPGIAIDPSGSQIIAGSQDNGTQQYFGVPVWDGFLATGDGGYNAINPKTPSIIYSSGYWVDGPNLFRCDLTGCRQRQNGIVKTDRSRFFPPFVMDQATPTKLYFGTQRLYRTVDDGATWVPLGTDLSLGSGYINAIALAPSDSMSIYVSTSDARILYSRDGGITFLPGTGFPNRVPTRIAVDPANAMHAIASASGFGTTHLWVTVDGGVSWSATGTNLPDAPANSVVFIDTKTVFAGTDVGVFQSADGGTTWTAGPSGLPNVQVQDVAYGVGLKQLVAATYGRGMWAYSLGGETVALRGDVNGDGKVDAADALLIQQVVARKANGGALYLTGDANCNGALDLTDALIVLRAAVGLPTAGSCLAP